MGEYTKSFNKFCPKKVEVNEATIDEVVGFGCFMKKSDAEVTEVIKGFHRFLKACITKHINHGLEWNELTPMATVCYNFFSNCSGRESAFFIMFGRDPINKLNMMLHAARRYFHEDNGLTNLEALKNIYSGSHPAAS